MMEKSDCNLNQSLQKLLLSLRRSPPDVFEYFMGVKKFGAIEQFDTLEIRRGIHTNIVARAGGVPRIYKIS
jgi:hypothetical protein